MPKGTMTNLGKLVGWDIDHYLSLSDEECLICLSERDRYALGQALMQMRWSTRWNSDIGTPLPDLDAIASRLDDKMSDESCIDICQMIIDCIANNQTIQQQISFYSGFPSITAETGEVIEYLETDLLLGQGSVSCDIDSVFGATTQLTDFLNMLSVDLLEIFTGAFAVPERLADVISAIPVVETLPLDEILEFSAKMAQQIENSYNSAYDSQIRDDFRCDLRCLTLDNDCILTLEIARDYFYDKIVIAVTKTDFLQIVNDVIANNWLGEQSIYLMHFMILQAIIYGGEILGIDVNRISRQVATFFNDPDPDWSTLCDECPDITEVCQNFVTDGLGDWYFDPAWGNETSSGLTTIPSTQVAVNDWNNAVYIKFDLGGLKTVTQVKATMEFLSCAGNDACDARIRLLNSSNGVVATHVIPLNSNIGQPPTEYVFNTSTLCRYVWINIYNGHEPTQAQANTEGNARILDTCIRYSG